MFETLLARGEHLAEVQAERALLRFLNGIDWLIRDPAQAIGRTPYDVVYRRDKLEVRRYHHAHADVPRRHDLPVLLIPVWTITASILTMRRVSRPTHIDVT